MTHTRSEQARPDDEVLREAYAALRTDTERTVPDFGAMIAGARERAHEVPDLRIVDGSPSADTPARLARLRGRFRIGAWVSLAAAAVSGLLLIRPARDSADADFERLVAAYTADATLGAWRSPTDALLRTPGVDLGAVPAIGTAVRSGRPGPEEGRNP